MRILTTSIACVVAASLLNAAPQSAEIPPLDELMRRATEYVRSYQKDFSFLVAEEHYTQQVVSPWVQGNKARKITGEMFLTYLQVDQEWVAVRDVKTVDGVPVDARTDVRALLADGSAKSVAQQVMAINAQYNIGSVKRDFNEPTFGLLPLGTRWSKNFTFERGKINRSDPARPLVTLTFKEHGSTTIIQTPDGQPVLTRGEVDIDPATGRVVRTFVQFDIGLVHAEQSTVYEPDTRLDLWVPAVYTERYALTYRGRIETTTGRAVFTNYQRFGVTARIKK